MDEYGNVVVHCFDNVVSQPARELWDRELILCLVTVDSRRISFVLRSVATSEFEDEVLSVLGRQA